MLPSKGISLSKYEGVGANGMPDEKENGSSTFFLNFEKREKRGLYEPRFFYEIKKYPDIDCDCPVSDPEILHYSGGVGE
jgi:hypothetical protein